MNKKKLSTVTVAISALNEGQNIDSFLRSVLNQKEEGFVLNKILVISDGSTDDTVKKVKSLKSPKIILKDYADRTGKSNRLNEIYTGLSSDILVQSDADVIFSHPYVIRDIIKPLQSENNVGMCGGHPKPSMAITFVERAVNCSFEVYDGLRGIMNNGNNSLSADGRLLAFKKELVKKIRVPLDMISNDAYTYFCCITLGYEYRYVESAVVHFRSPQTLKDQIKQNTRFVSTSRRMARYFPKEVILREDYIPRDLLYKRMIVQLIRHPILGSYIFLINLYCRLRSVTAEKKLTAKWPMAYSTKNFKDKGKS